MGLGISTGDLDRFVKEARAEKVDEMEMLHDHWRVLPWDEAVDGKILFRALSECIRQIAAAAAPGDGENDPRLSRRVAEFRALTRARPSRSVSRGARAALRCQ